MADLSGFNADDHEAHGCLTCISTGKQYDDPDRMSYPPNVFLKSPQEMRALFHDFKEACDNTLAIAERCNLDIDLSSQHAPRYQPEDGSTAGAPAPAPDIETATPEPRRHIDTTHKDSLIISNEQPVCQRQLWKA